MVLPIQFPEDGLVDPVGNPEPTFTKTVEFCAQSTCFFGPTGKNSDHSGHRKVVPTGGLSCLALI